MQQITLSAHARTRLQERTQCSEEELLELLNNGAYEIIHKDEKRVFSQSMAELAHDYGRKKSDFAQPSLACRHILVWSEANLGPIVAIVGTLRQQVITILTPGCDNFNYWPSRTTPAVVDSARKKSEALRRGEPIEMARVLEVMAAWLDLHNNPKRKTVAWKNLDPEQKSPHSRLDLIRRWAVDVSNARNGVYVCVRDRKDPSCILLELNIPAEG